MKQIQDFKMKCENVQQRDEVIRILEENGVKLHVDYGGLAVINTKGQYQILNGEYFEQYGPKRKLTYKKFMQLYSEPKQDELMELKEWIDKNQDTIETQDGIKGGVVWVDEILSKLNEMIERRNKPI